MKPAHRELFQRIMRARIRAAYARKHGMEPSKWAAEIERLSNEKPPGWVIQVKEQLAARDRGFGTYYRSK